MSNAQDLWKLIADARDCEREPVRIDRWGLEQGAFVAVLDGHQRERLERKLAELADGGNLPISLYRRWWVAYCLVDADGRRIIADEHVDDLADKSGGVVAWLYDQVERMNGLNQDAQAKN